MSQSPDPLLVQAYELIKAGQREQAAQMLRSYLAAHPRDADAWWLMAHTTTQTEAARSCLEKVLALNPNHTKAQQKLARMQPAAPSAIDFVMPSDLAAPQDDAGGYDWGGIMGGALAPRSSSQNYSTSVVASGFDQPADNPFGSPVVAYSTAPRAVTTSSRAAPKQKRSSTEIMIGLGLLVLALIVVAGIFLYKGSQEGWFDVPALSGSGEVSGPGVLQTDHYTMHFPPEWAAKCAGGLLQAEVCGFSTDEDYLLLDMYTSDDWTADSALAQANQMLFKGGRNHPGLVLTGIVMDFEQTSGSYESIRDSILWWEQLYLQWRGRTNYIQGYDLWVEYNKQNPVIQGETSYIYCFEGRDKTGQMIFEDGFFVVCDGYVPHDAGNRMLFVTLIGYSPNSIDEIPKYQIDHMLQGLTFK